MAKTRLCPSLTSSYISCLGTDPKNESLFFFLADHTNGSSAHFTNQQGHRPCREVILHTVRGSFQGNTSEKWPLLLLELDS